MIKNKKIYYAHSLCIYNSKRERKEFKFLKKKFNVFNPKTEIQWNPILKMAPYLIAVKDNNILVCSEYKKHIGKGVYEEIKIALQFNIPIFVLRKKIIKYRLLRVKDVELVNRQDWKITYGKIILNRE